MNIIIPLFFRESGNNFNTFIYNYSLLHKLKSKSTKIDFYILRYGEIAGRRLFNEKNIKCKQTLDGFKLKYGEVEGEIKYKQYCVKKTHSLDSYILRHGEIEGHKKFNEYWKNTNFSTSKPAYIRRHGEIEGVNLYNERCTNVSNWSKGDSWEDKNEYKDFIKKRSIKIKESGTGGDNVSLPKLLTKYTYDDAIKKYNNTITNLKKSNVLCKEYYISRNILNYESIIKEIQCVRNTNTIGYASKSSLKVLIPIYKYLRKYYNIHRDDIFLGVRGSKEFRIKTKTNLFLYDFTIKSKKIIIEFNGLYYHILPDSSNLNMHSYKSIDTIEKLIERDELKRVIASQNGYEIIDVWDNKSSSENIKFIKNTLDNILGNI